MDVVVTGKIGIRASIVGGDAVVLAKVGMKGVVLDHEPRTALAKIGISASIVGSHPPETLTCSFGIKSAIVDSTLPADGRTNWTTVATAARDFCHEVQPLVRGKTVQQAEYGTLTLYTRQFNIPRGNHGQAILETILAPGAHMRTTWANDEWFSLALDGPKAMSGAQVHQHVTKAGATGSDVVQVTFAAIKTLAPVSSAYTATARRLLSSDAFGATYVEWGIAPSLSAAGVPCAGTWLFGYAGNFAPICFHVEPSDTALPGRWLIKSTYRQKLVDNSSVRMRPCYVEDVFTDSGHARIQRRPTSRRTGASLSVVTDLSGWGGIAP